MALRPIVFGGRDYASIFLELLANKRKNLPELTDESQNDPIIQILSMMASVLSTMNGLGDHIVEESFIDTAKDRSSLKSLAKLVGYRVKESIPSTVDIVARLTAPVSSSASVPAGVKFSTDGGQGDRIDFESDSAVTLSATDVPTIFLYNGTSFTQHTSAFDTGTPTPGDAIYFGHSQVMFDKFDFTYTSLGTMLDSAATYVLEYYDSAKTRFRPDNVTDNTTSITFEINGMLGSTSRSGATVYVECLRTGVTQEVETSYSSANTATVTGTLGQSSVSTSPADYSVYAVWKEVPSFSLDTSLAGSKRRFSFTLPQSADRNWSLSEIEGVSAYWMRFRVINSSATQATGLWVDITVGSQYAILGATQGETLEEDPAGSTSGLPGQYIQTGRDKVIDSTPRIYVDEGGGYIEYAVVDDFSRSSNVSRDVILDYTEDGEAVFFFGDGDRGFVPPVGSNNIKVTYRRGAEKDGNVGASTITKVGSYGTVFSRSFNPRSASGWAPPEGSTAASLEELRAAIPASLRVLERVLTADDLQRAAELWVSSTGSSPIARVSTIENGSGPKTVTVLVCGPEGEAIANSDLLEFEDHLNGDPVSGAGGVMVMNVEADVVNFDFVTVDVTCTIEGGDTSKATAALQRYLSATSLKANGDFNHYPGDTIFWSKLVSVIHDSDSDIESVTLTVPSGDILLGDTELPLPGTILVTA